MRDWRVYGAFALGAAGAWAAGLAYATIPLIGLAAVAAVLVATRLDGRADPEFDRAHPVRRNGARGEVQDLAWAMVARDGRVSGRVMKRVREVAADRLARHGLALGDAADDDAIRALVGTRAHRTLTRTASPSPTLADLRHTLDTLDRITTTSTTGNGSADHGSLDA